MKTKNLTPRNTAPVKRENVATVSTDVNAIAPAVLGIRSRSLYGRVYYYMDPFAGDEAE